MSAIVPCGVLLWFVLLCLGALACSASPPRAEGAGATQKTQGDAGNATTGAPLPAWDPGEPVDIPRASLRTMFVVVPRSAVCPTREQAQARECGNSVESVEQGTREVLGAAVTVVGDRPERGMWRALRYQKAGTLPGWIRADDVAERARTDALDAFDQRADIGRATDAAGLSREQLSQLKRGTLVRWIRTRAVKLGSFHGHVYIYIHLADGGAAAVEMPSPEEDESYIRNHPCLVYGDCLELAYVCRDSYCDEVSMLARATGKTIAPPDDPEGEWTATEAPIPLFEAVALADRFGAFPGPRSRR